MKRPEKALRPSDFQQPLGAKQTRRLLAYLLRATVLRASKDSLGEHRYHGLTGELATQLIPIAAVNRTCLGFYRVLCERFSIDPTGSDTDWGPVEAWLPEGRIRWDRALAVMDYETVRIVIEESPEFLATFAREHGDEQEDADFDLFPDPVSPGHSFTPELPGEIIAPNGYRAVWTLTRPLHHGADQKSGNVNMFRRQSACNPLTGKIHQVPFIAGNAIRGQWRDLVMGRWLQLIGLRPEEIPPLRAHSLLAGGSVDQGADGAIVNNIIRREARDKCPPWDLIAGNTEQQIMSGRLRVGDAILVCRENAWLVRDAIAPGVPIAELAASLPEAETMTHRQQLVRNKHADIEQSDGVQALVQKEVIAAGYQMFHTVQLFGLGGINPVTASCLADLLGHFREIGTVGADASRGRGNIAFDAYAPGPGTPDLPGPDLYLESVEKRRDEMIEWAMSATRQREHRATKGRKSKATVVEAAE